MALVTFRDETATGRALEERPLPDMPERISARVSQEVVCHNTAPSHHCRNLVKPANTGAGLNSYRMRTAPRLGWEKQTDAAFTRYGFLPVGDRQIEDVNTEVDLAFEPVVSFIKLVPLVGG
ncbi:hypothetical protein [Herbidospora daliensis]|uniref:hypothetical protein n=1 Tax=Herbidospora daliensis TaxID=295585 RepID=UPI0007822205|nr:hypothetical protein [Herbidospora daliensis]